jgi:cyanophycinase
MKKCRDQKVGKAKVIALCLSLVAIGLVFFVTNALSTYLLNLNSNIAPSFTGVYGGGTLVIAGGGNLPPEIQNRFREFAGGDKARLVVVPSYDATPSEVIKLNKEWKQLKTKSLDILHARSREDGESEALVSKVRNATGVWFTGGEQTVPAAYYPGTAFESELWNLLDRGGVIGGTSAGAAIMSRIMISEGKYEAKTSQGLDLLRGAVIDQHFMQRNRLTRLRGVLDQHPHAIGVGVDEGTALVVQVRTGKVGVIGNSYVMLWAPSGQSAPHRAEFLKAGDTYLLEQLDWQNEPLDYQL